eukprot:352088-Chlamydomonas_euryale.AAC.3
MRREVFDRRCPNTSEREKERNRQPPGLVWPPQPCVTVVLPVIGKHEQLTLHSSRTASSHGIVAPMLLQLYPQRPASTTRQVESTSAGTLGGTRSLSVRHAPIAKISSYACGSHATRLWPD